jgi:cyclic beta-1,2-glucan synthetase
MLNPLTHTSTRAGADRYKVEPYVVAADVYTAEGQLGRGGWTWYTGSASWSYRVALETLLGFTKRGETVRLNPCIPSAWPEFSIEYRFGTATYAFVVRNPDSVSTGVASTTCDGRVVEGGAVRLVDDGKRHEVVVVMGAAQPQF